MLGRVFKPATSRQTAQYAKLPQEDVDDDESDHVLFKQDGHIIGSIQNGSTKKLPEGENCNGAASPPPEMPELVKVRVLKYSKLSRTRIACYTLSVIFCLLLASMFAFVFPYLNSFKSVLLGKTYDTTADWEVTFPHSVSASPVRLVDADADGRLDILISTSSARDCQKTGPCSGRLLLLQGSDGAEVWHVNTSSDITAVNCGHIDINKDGRRECLVVGYKGLLFSVESRTGTVLWNQQLDKDLYLHQPLVIPDVDDDGTLDILISASTLTPKSQEGPGKILLISGASGKLLGNPYVLADQATTIIPLVTHKLKDGSHYVLYGVGGFKSAGGLRAVALPDLVRSIMGWDSKHTIPNVKGDYKAWIGTQTDESGHFIIYSNDIRGVAVPPVCADVNYDGTKDILVATLMGELVMYDGETLKQLWKCDKFLGYQALSLPAPGYFNMDKVLDFMVTLNLGTWPVYSNSKHAVLDGKTGELLWTLTSTEPEFSSSLAIRTRAKYRDAFLLHLPQSKTNGQEEQMPTRKRRAAHGRTHFKKNSNYRRPHDRRPYPDDGYNDDRPDPYSQDIPEYMKDRLRKWPKAPYDNSYEDPGPNMAPAPERLNPVAYSESEEFTAHPNKKGKGKGRRPGKKSKQKGKNGKKRKCRLSEQLGSGDLVLLDRTVLHNPIVALHHGVQGNLGDSNQDCITMPHPFTVGAVGDLDGDGKLDLLTLLPGRSSTDPSVTIKKTNLKTVIHEGNSTSIDPQNTENVGVSKQAKPLTADIFLHDDEQKWTEYMGKVGNSVYP